MISKLIKSIRNQLLLNKSLVILLIVLLIFSFTKPYITEYLVRFQNIKVSTSFAIYILLGILCLPTLPMNLLLGSIYGPFTAAIVVSLATSIIIFIQANLKKLFLQRFSSPKGSILEMVRNSISNVYVTLIIIRLNPFLPLPLTTAIYKNANLKKEIILSIFSFLGTLPAAFVIAAMGNLEATYKTNFWLVIILILFSFPSITISKKIRKKIRKKVNIYH